MSLTEKMMFGMFNSQIIQIEGLYLPGWQGG